MVGQVACDDVGQGANGDGVVAGNATAHPAVRRKIAEEGESRQTN